MVFMPPGSAKSTYASVEFPPWYLGRRPTEGVIAASHTQELAEDFGRKVRNIVATPEYLRLWGHTVAQDSAAAGRWNTTKGGHYYAVGVGGSVTGRRADAGLIDDPVKGREAADSEHERGRVWNWYLTDFLTRLKPNAIQLLIMTRWHEDDLAGRILTREASRWEVFELGMEAHPNDPLGRQVGERLWADYFTPEMVEVAKRDPRSWTALYQQRPSPDEGIYFKRDWFKREPLTGDLRHYITFDGAVTKDGGDFTEIGVWAIDADENVAAVDWWSGQTTADVWIDAILDRIQQYKPLCVYGESGVIRRAVEPFLTKRARERKAFARFEWIVRSSDKSAMAVPFQGRAAMGRVHIPETVWGESLLTQLLQFPAGRYDDKVDACALIGLALDQTIGGIRAAEKTQSRPDGWDAAFDTDEGESWRVQ